MIVLKYVKSNATASIQVNRHTTGSCACWTAPVSTIKGDLCVSLDRACTRRQANKILCKRCFLWLPVKSHSKLHHQLIKTFKNTGLQKIPRINSQYSVSFSPAEYGYESHFFPSRPVFQKIYNKDLKINIIGCL